MSCRRILCLTKHHAMKT